MGEQRSKRLTVKNIENLKPSSLSGLTGATTPIAIEIAGLILPS